MSAVNARPGNALLTRKVSQCDYLLATVVIVAITGCQMTSARISALAPNSTVIAQAVGTNATQQTWLETVTISYAHHFTDDKAEKNVQLANFNANSLSNDTLQVLAIRYPHPDGHKDRARVELVIADVGKVASKNPWYGRLGKTLSETLPGMSWGEGIREAKAIDIRLDELQQLLVECRNTALPVSAAGPALQQVRFTAEINGQHNVVQSVPMQAMEKLVARVAQEGRLISYSGSANELQRGLQQSAQSQLAGNLSFSPATELAALNVLTPLPPVNTH